MFSNKKTIYRCSASQSRMNESADKESLLYNDFLKFVQKIFQHKVIVPLKFTP